MMKLQSNGLIALAGVVLLALTYSQTAAQNQTTASRLENQKITTEYSSIDQETALKLYHESVKQAAEEFLSTIPAPDRSGVLYPFDSEWRTRGTDPSNTPSFCAALAWCVGWGLNQGEMSDEQLLGPVLKPSGIDRYAEVSAF